MSETQNEPKIHAISKPGENFVGLDRFVLLSAAAEKAANAFEHHFYLEAITLTESILATRLESRLTWVRRWQGNEKPVKFNTLGRLCSDLLHQNATLAPDWELFEAPIKNIREWTRKRNQALHEMAKLIEEDKRSFTEKYIATRAVSVEGFRVLLDYDAIDRQERRKNGKLTATDSKNGATSFDVLKAFTE